MSMSLTMCCHWCKLDLKQVGGKETIEHDYDACFLEQKALGNVDCGPGEIKASEEYHLGNDKQEMAKDFSYLHRYDQKEERKVEING